MGIGEIIGKIFATAIKFFSKVLPKSISESLIFGFRDALAPTFIYDEEKLKKAIKILTSPESYKTKEFQKLAKKLAEKLKVYPPDVVDVAGEIHWMVWTMIYEYLEKTFVPEPPLTYEKAKTSAIRFLALTGDANIIISLIDILAEALSLGQIEAVGRAFRNFLWTFGLGWLSWIVMGPGLRAGIAEGLEKEYRTRLRYVDIPRTIWDEAWRRGTTTRAEWKVAMTERGYPDKEIKLLETTAWRLLSISEILEAYHRARMVRDVAITKIGQHGYARTEAEIILEDSYRLPTPAVLREATFRRLLLMDQYYERMRMNRFRPKDAELYLEVGRPQLTDAQIEDLLKKGLLTEEQAWLRYVLRGWSEEDADLLVRSARMDLVEDVRELTKSDIIGLLKDGVITREDALIMLTALGFPLELAELLILRAEALMARPPVRRLTISQAVRAFKDYKIPKELCKEYLTLHGMPELDQLILIAPKVTEPEIQKLLLQYYERKVSVENVKKALEAAEYTEQEIEILLELWKPKSTGD